MLNAIKRWISRSPSGPDWSEVSEWARGRGWGYKRARDDEGFVVEGAFEGRPWRLEWGPPQRAYIAMHELRLRMELHVPQGLQMLLMERTLLEQLERETFERYTERNQTVIDVSMPEEMRWLAMFPKASLDLPKPVRNRFGAVSSAPAAAIAWVDIDFGDQLGLAAQEFLPEGQPFVLMTLRGRLYLRLQLTEPDTAVMSQAIALFQTAAEAALRVAAGSTEERPADFSSTASTAWQTDVIPEDPPDRRR